MPKKLEEIPEDQIQFYLVCEICKQLYLINEMSMYYIENSHVGKCIFCTAIEREAAIKQEEEVHKQHNKDRSDKINKYLKDHPKA